MGPEAPGVGDEPPEPGSGPPLTDDGPPDSGDVTPGAFGSPDAEGGNPEPGDEAPDAVGPVGAAPPAPGHWLGKGHTGQLQVCWLGLPGIDIDPGQVVTRLVCIDVAVAEYVSVDTT